MVGLNNFGDKVTFHSKWKIGYRVNSVSVLMNIMSVEEVLQLYKKNHIDTAKKLVQLPKWFVRESYQ